MRVLVLGGGGQVARAVVAAAGRHHHVVTRTRVELDIRDAKAVARELAGCRADWIINAAAFTAVDAAEDHPAQAVAVNDTAVGVLARAAAEAHCRILHLSTDFIFDGTANRAYLPEDLPNPLSVYGRSKLAGEHHILNGPQPGIVLRTAWVYAAQGKNFVLTMLRLMRDKEQLSVVCDQIGTPTWAAGLAGAIWELIEGGVSGGIYHWTDLGVASWYDFAVAIQDEAGARGLLRKVIPIYPIATADYPTPARRPAFSVLDSQSTRAVVRVPAQHWRHNLRTMLNEL